MAFLGAVAAGRLRAIDRQNAEDQASRQNALQIALLMHRIEREKVADAENAADRQFRYYDRGLIPDSTETPAPINGQAPQQAPSTIKGYHYDSSHDPSISRHVAQHSADQESDLESRMEKIRSLDPNMSDANVRALAGTTGLYDAFVRKHLGLNPPKAARSEQGVEDRAGFNAVSRQLSDARDDLRRAIAVKAPTYTQAAMGADSSAYKSAQSVIPQLRQRVDSLSAVRDQKAAQVQGRVQDLTNKVQARRSGQKPPEPKTRETVEAQDEYDFLRQTMTDAQIAQRYNINAKIRRDR